MICDLQEGRADFSSKSIVSYASYWNAKQCLRQIQNLTTESLKMRLKVRKGDNLRLNQFNWVIDQL